LRNTPGGKKLSAETIMLLSLAVYDDYLLFPSAEERNALALGLARPQSQPVAGGAVGSTLAGIASQAVQLVLVGRKDNHAFRIAVRSLRCKVTEVLGRLSARPKIDRT
jgi:hypothetical protein